VTAAVLDGADATSGGLAQIPPGFVVGLYVTGTGGVPATAAQLAAYPGAVRYAQWPDLAVDEAAHADVLDVETNAATADECAPWAVNAIASYAAAVRPGQRHPAIYCGDGAQTAYVNAMVAAGITSGVGLILVNWDLTRDQAVAVVQANAALPAAGNPFPVVGVQYGEAGGGGAYDLDIYLASWVNTVSGGGGGWLTAAQMEAIMGQLPVLQSGMSDTSLPAEYVHRLQAILRYVYGYYTGAVDGAYGPATAAAVKTLQARYGLTQDGICGALTWMPAVTGVT
jgi:Putative peptidoglycan binding domain